MDKLPTVTNYDRRSISLAVALSALAGYIDAIGFLATGGFFAAFMSGNSTKIGVGFGQNNTPYALFGIEIIGCFVIGVIAGSLVAAKSGERRKSAVLLLVASLLAVAAFSWTERISHIGMIAMVMAMGAENAIFQRNGETTIGLTYMTGTLVKLGQRIAAIFQGGSPWAWVPYAFLWLGLASGATLGAYSHRLIDVYALWPGVGAALILAGVATRFPVNETKQAVNGALDEN